MAAIIRRAKMWSATDLSAELAGSNLMEAIGTLAARFWERDMQKERIAILNGIFGTIPAGDSEEPPAETRLDSNLLDISSGSGNAAKWSGSAFIDAEQLLGDTVQPSSDPGFNTYQGKRIIVDDGCPVSGRVYTTYLFGAGAVAFGNGNPVGFVPTETDSAKRKGGLCLHREKEVC